MYNNDPKYMNPQQGLASLVNSPYGDSDVMQVRMTPNEVAGLQQLARSYGAQEQDLYDPITGQPKFSFLKKILPMVAGALLGPGGAGIFKTALGAATAVGLGYGLIEGDLKKGLMAGLGAYSGSKIGEGLRAAATAPAIEPPPTASLKDTSFKFSTDPIDQDVPLSTLRDAQISSVTGKPMMPVQTVTQAPPMPAPQPPQGMFGTAVQGAKNIFTGQEGAAGRFMDALGGPVSRYATLMGGISALTPEQKPLEVPNQEDIMYIPGGFNPQYGTGADQPYQLPGRYYKKTKKGLVPYNPYQMAPGYADGGQVNTEAPEWLKNSLIIDPAETYSSGAATQQTTPQQTTPQQTTPQQTASNQQPTANSIVEANRAYVEQLNRRAMKPEFTPYGMIAGGGLGGTNQPWTGTNPYGGPVNQPPGGGETTGGDTAAQTAAFLATQIGINWMMQPGNALALKNWITGGMKWADRPFLNADKAATGTGTGTGTGQGQGQGQTGQGQGQTQTGGEGQTTTGGEGPPKFDPVKGAVIAGGTSAAAIAAAKALAAKQGLASVGVYAMDGTLIANVAGAGAATGAAGAATGAAGAATGTGAATGATSAAGAGTTAGGAGAGGGGAAAGGAGTSGGIGSAGFPGGAAGAGLATLAGAYLGYEGIRKGKEGQAALGGGLAGAGGAYLAGTAGLGGAGLTTLAGFGPVGLAAAAIAAIGASLVNTKEQGDVALRNYWKAVDQGRGLASAPPQELAEGFINFYRTNKNNFAGQEKYGRKGNEDFIYDMTQVINKGVESGAVSKDAKPEEIYQKVVQPWLNSMGEGPKDADARRIQDFMMTDLIYNFMLGRPISNAQVKNDKKFKIVSQKPVYAGNPPPLLGQLEQAKTQALGQGVDGRKLAEYLQAQNPYGQTMPFAEGGAIGEDYNFGFAGGGQMPTEYLAGGKLLDGPGDGMSDSIPAVIRGKGVQRAALADGEFVVPADVVSHLGNGSTKAGAKKLYGMMDRIREARTGRTRQAPQVNAERALPA